MENHTVGRGPIQDRKGLNNGKGMGYGFVVLTPCSLVDTEGENTDRNISWEILPQILCTRSKQTDFPKF
jgi:hypothetical protein